MNKIKSAKRDVDLFKEWFNKKYGVNPRIIYTFPSKRPLHSLRELIDIINQIIKNNPYEYDAECGDIEIPSREEMIVLYRHLYFYIAHNWGYKLIDIGRGLRKTKHHATVLHGIRRIEEQIEIGDKKVITKLNLVLHAIEEKLGTDGNVPKNYIKEFNPESVLSPVLPQGEHSQSTNKPSSRYEGSNSDWIC